MAVLAKEAGGVVAMLAQPLVFIHWGGGMADEGRRQFVWFLSAGAFSEVVGGGAGIMDGKRLYPAWRLFVRMGNKLPACGACHVRHTSHCPVMVRLSAVRVLVWMGCRGRDKAAHRAAWGRCGGIAPLFRAGYQHRYV